MRRQLAGFVDLESSQAGLSLHILRCVILDPVSKQLLRKEVIQPHLPIRLPCYDFIPITTHTFGTYPPEGLNQRLRVQKAFMM